MGGVQAAIAEAEERMAAAFATINGTSMVASSSLEEIAVQREAMRRWAMEGLRIYNRLKTGYDNLDMLHRTKISGHLT